MSTEPQTKKDSDLKSVEIGLEKLKERVSIMANSIENFCDILKHGNEIPKEVSKAEGKPEPTNRFGRMRNTIEEIDTKIISSKTLIEGAKELIE